MSDIKFTPVDVPTVGRPATPNPYTAIVGDLAAKVGRDTPQRALSFDVATDADATKAKRLLQAAGKDHGVSVRTKVLDSDGAGAVVTFWCVARITRAEPADAPA